MNELVAKTAKTEVNVMNETKNDLQTIRLFHSHYYPPLVDAAPSFTLFFLTSGYE